MSNYILYGITIILLIISFYKDKKKTKMALKKAWKSFENILPEFLGVIMLVGVLLAVLNAEVISKIIGSNSGWFGVIAAALVGCNNINTWICSFSNSSNACTKWSRNYANRSFCFNFNDGRNCYYAS